MVERQPPTAPAPVLVRGAPKTPFRDIYYRFLRLRWSVALGIIVVVVLALNAAFAFGYFAVGGVANMRPGSFRDAFYFSVHTFATIGYGSMYPTSDPAEILVVAEALIGLLTTALSTGLLVAKLTISTARIVFTHHVTISPMNGVPTLMFRLSNERGNQIVEAQIRVVIVKTEHTSEGQVFYRMLDLPLSRERSPAFSRSWTALHPIDETSPLHGATPETLEKWELELMVSVFGTDDTLLQPIHARHTYTTDGVLWGMRHVDILTESESGQLILDLEKFHEVEPTNPTKEFPYSAGRHLGACGDAGARG